MLPCSCIHRRCANNYKFVHCIQFSCISSNLHHTSVSINSTGRRKSHLQHVKPLHIELPKWLSTRMTTRYSSTSFAQSSQPVLFDGPSLSGAEPEPSAPPSPQIYALYSWKRSPNARLAYLRDTQKANDEVAKLRSGPLGFDLEWKPSFRKGQKENAVALVQLATEDMVLIIQVSAMQSAPLPFF